MTDTTSDYLTETKIQYWKPTSQQQRDWDEKGYFIMPNVVSSEAAAEMRGVIKNVILSPEPDARTHGCGYALASGQRTVARR